MVQKGHAAVVLAVALGLIMVIVCLGNIIIGHRCLDSFDNYVKQVNPEEPPKVCDTSAEMVLVLDIGLALSGGLVGFLAADAGYNAGYKRSKNSKKEV